MQRILPMKHMLVVGIGLISAMGLGCGEVADEETSEGLGAYSEEDTKCFSERPRAGESATDARARCLSARADAMLDAVIKAKEDPQDGKLDALRGKLKVRGETGCFTEDVPGGWTGLWQNDIDSARDVGMLSMQIRASVEFLKYFYRDLSGYSNHFFDAVEICPNGQVGGDLRLEGSRLRIGVRTGFGGRYGFHSGKDLRTMWSSGDHLDGSVLLSALKGKANARWMLLDPVGTPRTIARKIVRDAVKSLSGRLDALTKKNLSPEATRSELERLAQSELSDGVGADSASSESPRTRALGRIKQLSDSELLSFVKSWKVELEKPDVSEGAEEGAVGVRDSLASKDVSVKVVQNGIVNVQNYKQITVDTGFFLPNAEAFAPYVDVKMGDTNVNVEQTGFVNIQLNDVINVRVNVAFQRTAQAAAFDRAQAGR